jgi:hypothetical protein
MARSQESEEKNLLWPGRGLGPSQGYWDGCSQKSLKGNVSKDSTL